MTEPHAFSDLLEPTEATPANKRERDLFRLREADLLGKFSERAIKALDETKPAPRRYPCSECSKLAEQHPDIPIPEAESWLGLNGRRYWGANCADCVDRAWSKRYAAKADEARKNGNLELVRELERRRTARIAAGRRVYA